MCVNSLLFSHIQYVICKFGQFYLLFQSFWLYLFFLPCWQKLELPALCLIRVMRVGILAFILVLRGKDIQYFTSKYDFSCRFIADILYRVEEVPLIPSFLRVFIMNWYWILSNALSVSNDIWFFFFSLLIWYFKCWSSLVCLEYLPLGLSVYLQCFWV